MPLDLGPSSLGWMSSVCPSGLQGTEVAQNLANILLLTACQLGTVPMGQEPLLVLGSEPEDTVTMEV